MGSSSNGMNLRSIVALVAAFALAACLAGCSGQSGSSSAEASSGASTEASASAESAAASAEESSASDEATESSASAEASESEEFNDQVEVSEEFAQMSEIAKNIALNGAGDSTATFNSLPTSEDESLNVFEDFQVAPSDDDSARAATSTRSLKGGGVEMLVPSTWAIEYGADAYRFMNDKKNIVGDFLWARKKSDVRYDYPAMTRELASQLAQGGAKNVTIIDSGNTMSSSGATCGAFILVGATIQGIDGVYYAQFVGSKSYVHLIEFTGDIDSFNSELETIANAINSEKFIGSEGV